MIPKIFHYIWFGRKKVPHPDFIEGWQQLHPDWEVKKWDEDNLEVESESLYNALKTREWSNATNIARLFILQKEGGVYLDTDVEIVKSFDPFISHHAFVGFQVGPGVRDSEMVNMAVFGAEKNHPCFRELIPMAEKHPGMDTGHNQIARGPAVITSYLRERNLNFSEEVIEVADITIFPKKVFYPYLWNEKYTKDCISEETRAIHHWDLSWWKQSSFETLSRNPFRKG